MNILFWNIQKKSSLFDTIAEIATNGTQEFLIMPTTDFSEIDNLHSEWSRMRKAQR